MAWPEALIASSSVDPAATSMVTSAGVMVITGIASPLINRRPGAHIDGGVTLDDLARACDLSKRHFTRAFRQSTRMAPYQWLQYRRMEKAKQLLKTSFASLSVIALDCGFADQSHFTRTFSRLVGVTPGIWRRTNRT